MISFEDAYKIVLGEAHYLPAENVPLTHSLDRFLAGDAVSDADMPPFDRSAVDGYAIRREDLMKEMEVTGTIPAGKKPLKRTGPGQCLKIMTGAMLPAGADCVIMIEDTETTGRNRIRFTREKTGTNIIYKGEDVRKGQKILDKGIRLHPQHLAVLAAAGIAKVKVSRRAKTGILSTGNELVEPGRKLTGAKIRNSNSWQLAGQVMKAGGLSSYYGIATDKKNDLAEKLSAALSENDIVLVSGGVSMGDLDLVPGVFRDLGVKILFHGISIQPGKPALFGRKGRSFVFGLPGNPVSSFVLFEILVKPFMIRIMGGTPTESQVKLPLAEDFNRRKSSRKAFVPVRIFNGGIYPVEYHGSAHIHAYSGANGIITLDEGIDRLAKGEVVYVRQI